MLNIILFGAPGSGKGTQSEKIVEKFHLKHISTGDLLRSEIAAGTPLGKEAKQFMNKGVLVPDAVVIGIIGETIENNKDANGFLFDGFPRTTAQAEALDKLLKLHKTQIDVVLALDVNENELIKRLLERGKTSGRADDSSEGVVRSRIEEYHKKTEMVTAYYKQFNKVKTVRGEGAIDDIFKKLFDIIERYA